MSGIEFSKHTMKPCFLSVEEKVAMIHLATELGRSVINKSKADIHFPSQVPRIMVYSAS